MGWLLENGPLILIVILSSTDMIISFGALLAYSHFLGLVELLMLRACSSPFNSNLNVDICSLWLWTEFSVQPNVDIYSLVMD